MPSDRPPDVDDDFLSSLESERRATVDMPDNVNAIISPPESEKESGVNTSIDEKITISVSDLRERLSRSRSLDS